VDGAVTRYGRLDDLDLRAKGGSGRLPARRKQARDHRPHALGRARGGRIGCARDAVAPGPLQTAVLDRVTGDAETKANFLASVPQGRAGEPRKIADAIVFLTSDKAGFLTGQRIAIDGGVIAA
jgi:enoyl-[acyl-carrier-protein] reductase (NADH)